MTMQKIRIAVAQIRISKNIQENIHAITNMINQGSDKYIDVICFPECALTGYLVEYQNLDFSLVKNGLDQIVEKAKRTGMYIIIGTPLKLREDIYNSAVILSPNGDKYIYHKHYLTESEKNVIKSGHQLLQFKVGFVRCGVIICRDQNSHSLIQEYQKKGVSILFILAAHYYTKAEAHSKLNKNRALPIARAIDNRLMVAKSNTVGLMDNKISLGNSMIIDRKGIIITEADELEETLLIGEFTL